MIESSVKQNGSDVRAGNVKQDGSAMQSGVGTRIESDLLGEIEIRSECYYGINTARAANNFNLKAPAMKIRIFRELALVKKAAAMANNFVSLLSCEKVDAICQACDEIIAGAFDEQFVVNSLQGGAGTSANMNINEVIANRAIELLGGTKGDYSIIHPLNDVNLSQSTNDVFPTAVKIAAIRLVRQLSSSLAHLQETLQEKEREFSGILRLGRTELMDALPIQVGQGIGAWAQAIARDRWRIYKSEERLRQVNIGGTAIGTGMNALPKYIFAITENIQKLSGLGISRAESTVDATANADVFAEVSGLLKTGALNLAKISGDLRLLASGPMGGLGELKLPELQAGSTIMPGKVNPVITEMVTQVSFRVMGNDQAIALAALSGQLELNAFLPLIAECLIESLELLDGAVNTLADKCISGIKVDAGRCADNLERSSALAAALIDHIGYDKAAGLAKTAVSEHRSVYEIAVRERILDEKRLKEIFNPMELTKPGIPGGGKKID